jgi:hypothetical protein
MQLLGVTSRWGFALMADNLVNVRTFHYRHEAELAKSALEANGIDAIVVSDDGGRQEISLQFVRGAKLLVNSADADKAKFVLDIGQLRG